MFKEMLHCSQCSYVSAKKYNLHRHEVAKHRYRPKRTPTSYHCDKCEYITKKSSNLKRHASTHLLKPTWTIATEKVVEFQCYHCSYVTVQKSCLRSHMLRNHLNDRLNQPRITCSACGLKVFTRSQLREHLVEIHDVAIEEEIRTFTNEDEFLKWKGEIERVGSNKYVRNCGMRTYAGGVRKKYYNCYRDGFFKPVLLRKKALKKQGSNKIDSSCPSEMVYTENRKGEIVVYYVSTHFGHEHIMESTSDEDEVKTEISAPLAFYEFRTMEDVQCDSKDASASYIPADLSEIDDNSQLRCKIQTALGYLEPPYHYTEETKSRISKILDQVLDVMRAEAGKVFISNDCVKCEILSAEEINERLERPSQESVSSERRIKKSELYSVLR